MNEIKIREQLIKELAKQHPYNTEFLAELPIARFSRRIDLVMANGSLSGFEIKSEQDSLQRLAGQLETYVQYFENVTVVCASKHLDNVMKMVCNNVGVWEFDGCKLIEHQKPVSQSLSKLSWLSFLNVVGLKALLKAHHLKITGLKDDLIGRALSLDKEQIRFFLLDYLKQQFPQRQEKRQLKATLNRQNSRKNNQIEFNRGEFEFKPVNYSLDEEGFITLPSGVKVRPMLRR